ncbi:MAG: tRNA pseudouridine(38-40) synthase TruA [Candidatus Geothermarchaeales archaeon]
MRWAFKFAYLGRRFHGFQRQPGLRTVEGDVLEVLQSEGIIDDPRHSRFRTASRTDKDVSALGNVVAFNSSVDPRKVVSLLNASLDDVWFYAYTGVPDGFDPRKAEERWYRYHFPGGLSGESLEDAARLFEGKHDFRAFSKGGTRGVCDVREVRLEGGGEWTVLDIRADRFLWNMVRRVAGCLQMVAQGELALREVERALRGKPISVRLAPPQHLWLMDVSYAFPFLPFSPRKAKEGVLETRTEMRIRTRFFQELIRRIDGQ